MKKTYPLAPRLVSLIARNYRLDLRRLIIARDPLAVSDSFQVLIRVVLARLLGIRMCPDCPACMKSKEPCMNAYGSNAEPQGGVFGRADALFATVEYQRSGPRMLTCSYSCSARTNINQ